MPCGRLCNHQPMCPPGVWGCPAQEKVGFSLHPFWAVQGQSARMRQLLGINIPHIGRKIRPEVASPPCPRPQNPRLGARPWAARGLCSGAVSAEEPQSQPGLLGTRPGPEFPAPVPHCPLKACLSHIPGPQATCKPLFKGQSGLVRSDPGEVLGHGASRQGPVLDRGASHLAPASIPFWILCPLCLPFTLEHSLQPGVGAGWSGNPSLTGYHVQPSTQILGRTPLRVSSDCPLSHPQQPGSSPRLRVITRMLVVSVQPGGGLAEARGSQDGINDPLFTQCRPFSSSQWPLMAADRC